MSEHNNLNKEYDINIEFWKHYDNLRQEKNKTFLTANIILSSALGLIIKDEGVDVENYPIILIGSILGLTICILWFMLQTRNKKYIDFHRHQAHLIEKQIENYSTIQNQTKAMRDGITFEKISAHIKPNISWLSSNTIDRILSLSIAAFYGFIAIYFFGKYYC